MPTKTRVITIERRCKPFVLRVMVYSPEAGYKFTIEVQKACTEDNSPIWKLIFDLYKKIDNQFEEVVSVEFVAGDLNDINKIAVITEEGMKRPQVRAFRENVYPLVKPFADGSKPSSEQEQAIQENMDKAINAK